MQCCDMKYSDIRKLDVIDKDGDKVGSVMDCVFDCRDNKIELKQFIIGGGMVEELLESLGARPDVDPLCDLDHIDSINDVIRLNVGRDSLKNAIEAGSIPEGYRKFSDISKIKVVDSDDLEVGNVIDVWFDKDSKMWLVLGGGFLEEILEKIKAQPDIDLLVPPEIIECVDEKTIKLTRTRFQLESTCEDEYDKFKRQVAGGKPSDDARYPSLRLGTGHSRGLV